MSYGLQLYSVRDLAEKDLAAALQQTASLGYTAVEFAGFFGHSAREVRAMLDASGLRVSGTHSGLDELEKDFAGTVRYHRTLGNTRYILPGAPTATAAELEATIDRINRLQPRLAAEGITLVYHNHAGEFQPNRDGRIAHEELEKRTAVAFEIDTYWAFAAGCDPLALLDRLKDRVPVIHLKDGLRDGTGYPLGDGEAPVAAVRQKAMSLGMEMVVESETLQPDGMTEAARCMAYLRTLELSEK